MTPNWPELWEREPGLRPMALTHYGDIWALAYVDAPADEPDFGCETTISEGTASALCRDAAVRWLADRMWAVSINAKKAEGDQWEIGPSDMPNEERWGMGDTFDAALFAACKAVLASRLQPM